MCCSQGNGLLELRSTRLMKKTRYAAVLKMRLARVYLIAEWQQELVEMNRSENKVRRKPRIGIGIERI